MRLSAAMRDALEAAARNPLRRTHDDTPGAPPWPAHPATLDALTGRELLEHSQTRNRKGWRVDVWTITDHGREVLDPPRRYREDRPEFLARPTRSTGDYTTNPMRAIDHLEVIKDDQFARDARDREQHRRRQNGATLDTMTLADRITNLKVAAKALGVDVTGELWVAQRMVADGRGRAAERLVARLETKLRQRAA